MDIIPTTTEEKTVNETFEINPVPLTEVPISTPILEKVIPVKGTSGDTRGGARVGAGNKKGVIFTKTLEKKLALEEFRKRVRKNINKLYNAQFGLATGLTYVYKVVETDIGTGNKAHKKRENVLVTDSNTIKTVLDDFDGNNSGDVDGDYYFITTEKPDNKAIESLMDRAFGKSSQNLDITSGGKSMSVLIAEIEK